MKKIFALLFFTQIIVSQNLSQYVNPMIGTDGHGHTYPGATVPFGMVQLSPDTRIDGSWDGCSGYHYSDSIIYGFSHTHLNGTGCSDYGDIMLMPTMGEPTFNPKEYSSTFSHQNEKATAGFYSVKLDKHNIDVRLTTSTRVGFHEYTFNQNGLANIILDLNHRDKLLTEQAFWYAVLQDERLHPLALDYSQSVLRDITKMLELIGIEQAQNAGRLILMTIRHIEIQGLLQPIDSYDRETMKQLLLLQVQSICRIS